MVGPDEFGKTEAWYFLDADLRRADHGRRQARRGPDRAGRRHPDGRILEVAQTRPRPRRGRAVDSGGHAARARAGPPPLRDPAGQRHDISSLRLGSPAVGRSEAAHRGVGRGDAPGRAGGLRHPQVAGETGRRRRSTARYSRPRSHPGVAGGRAPGWTIRRAGTSASSRSIDGGAEISRGKERSRPRTSFETALVAGSAGAYEVRAPAARPASCE